MARIVCIITELSSGKIIKQECNQGSRPLLELEGEAFDKQVLDLVERTVHRIYGPNGAVLLTGFNARGKNAGYKGIVGKKAWGRPHTYKNAREVLINFVTEEGEKVLRPINIDDKEELNPTQDSATQV